MKRVVMLLGLMLIFITACSSEKPTTVDVDNEDPILQVEEDSNQSVHSFKANPSFFHFVGDWLTDSKILYVEKNEIYQVNYFDIETGESGMIYEDTSFITDIIVHPSQEYILIHTSDQSDVASLKVLTTEGAIMHEMEIASTEITVNWNPVDAQKLLITAFHEDWTFDIFIFNGHVENLFIVNIDDPFPKWAGTDQVVSIFFTEHLLDGGNLQFLNVENDEITYSESGDIIYFDTYGDRLLTVKAPVNDLFTFSMSSLDGKVISEWQMPAVSNYSEWVIPEVEWINENHMLFKSAQKSGQLDDIGQSFNLHEWIDGVSSTVMEDMGAEPLKCSPTGKYCLSGYTSEELIEKDTGVKQNWIYFEE